MPLNLLEAAMTSGVLKTANNLSEVNDQQEQAAPIGAIVVFTGSTIPKGWLLCDGSVYNSFPYAELNAVIGSAFGAGPLLPSIANLGANSRQRYIIKAKRFVP